MAAKVEKVGGVRDSLVEHVISPIRKESIPPYFNLNKSITSYSILAVPYIVRG